MGRVAAGCRTVLPVCRGLYDGNRHSIDGTDGASEGVDTVNGLDHRFRSIRSISRPRGIICPLVLAAVLGWASPPLRAEPKEQTGAAPPVADPSSNTGDAGPFPVDAPLSLGGEEEIDNDFAALDIEQLMSIEVTSVAGVEQQWFRTPAALYVITDEAIRSSGHRSIPEVLRLAPGVHVARINSHAWAISARGFNSRFANKLQVLIDGRTVYNPLFSGVFWDSQGTLLADIDRIEVIRGPGATLWGANAVNGVINVTTKPAAETQGGYFTGGIGTLKQGFGGVRYGGQIDDETFFRVWGKYENYDNFESPSGENRPDDWDMARGGFRLDREGSDHATLTLQGGVYHSDRLGMGFRAPDPTMPFSQREIIQDGEAGGAFLLGRIVQDNPDGSGWRLQGYYDRSDFARFGAEAERDTFEVDFRHHSTPFEGHEFIWGLAYRRQDQRTEAGPSVRLEPSERTLDTYSAFLQDTITLEPDTLFAMVGSKFEHNDFTGFEVQPSGRLWWTPNERQTLWGAISRPVRTPSLAEQDLRFTQMFTPFPPPNNAIVVRGNPDAEAEKLIAYELGHRIKLAEGLTLDTATFYNDYSNLLIVPPDTLRYANTGFAESYGAEVAASWRLADNWRLTGSYSFLRLQVRDDGNLAPDNREGNDPRHQAKLRSTFDIARDLEFNAALYYVGELEALDVPSYLRLDLGLAWRPTENLELAIWGQNLLDPSHPEFQDTLYQSGPAEVPRSVYFQATLRF